MINQALYSQWRPCPLTHCELAGHLAVLIPYVDAHVFLRAQHQQVVLGRRKDEKDEQRAATSTTLTTQVVFLKHGTTKNYDFKKVHVNTP